MPSAPPAAPRSPASPTRPGALLVGAGITVAVAAVSTAAILVRVAEAPSLALAFWRCALGAAAVAPFALRGRRRSGVRLESGQRRQLGWSGALLALHFALWVSSLSFTTVASAAVLGTSAPLFAGVGAAVFLGERPGRGTWVGMALAAGGAAVVASGDLGAEALGSRALLGDALALAGAAALAGYLLLGRSARQRLPTAEYAAVVYGTAALVLLAVCLATGTALGGYPAATWLAIAGLVAGPQLLGHTVFTALLATLTATVVAVAALAEPVGATLLAWLLLGELPAAAFWFGAPAILAGVWLATRSGRGA